jgi:hypothetical protein
VKKRVDSKIDQIDKRIRDLKDIRNALAQLSRTVGKRPQGECTLLDILEKSGS